MSSDDDEVKQIMGLSERELLDYVVDNPEYLTDPYYRRFGRAVYKRHSQLLVERTP